MAVNYNLEAEQGSSFVFHVKYIDDDNNVVDVSGMTASMQVRRYQTSGATALLHWFSGYTPGQSLHPSGVTAGVTGGSGGIKLNASYTGSTAAGGSGTTGGIWIAADPSTMRNVPSGQHFYDLELVDGNTVIRLVEGRFEVKGNVTR